METRFADWSDERLQREWDRDDKSDLAWTVALADELHLGLFTPPFSRKCEQLGACSKSGPDPFGSVEIKELRLVPWQCRRRRDEHPLSAEVGRARSRAYLAPGCVLHGTSYQPAA